MKNFRRTLGITGGLLLPGLLLLAALHFGSAWWRRAPAAVKPAAVPGTPQQPEREPQARIPEAPPETPQEAMLESGPGLATPNPEVAPAEHNVIPEADFPARINRGVPWPPATGQPYPDLVLKDSTGQYVPLSSFRGNVILVELVAMSPLPGQTFAAAQRYASLRTGTTSLKDPRLVYIQILRHNAERERPTLIDLQQWEENFQKPLRENRHVLQGTPAMLKSRIPDHLPAFHLIDRDFILRMDTTGGAASNLWKDILPALPELLDETGWMTIEQAYQELGRERFPYDFLSSRLGPKEKAFLVRFFNQTDQTALENAQALRWFQFFATQGRSPKDYRKGVGDRLQALESLDCPEDLKPAHRLTLEGLRDQAPYFEDWWASFQDGAPFRFKPGPALISHPAIRNSSQKLRWALEELQRALASECDSNRKAISCHLRVLDLASSAPSPGP
ncbi:MAG: hypothetical protein HYU36_17080 [Planctomycetes bacterium]|nr:hypothetical protein [Planctomycetota bacterium]